MLRRGVGLMRLSSVWYSLTTTELWTRPLSYPSLMAAQKHSQDKPDSFYLGLPAVLSAQLMRFHHKLHFHCAPLLKHLDAPSIA